MPQLIVPSLAIPGASLFSDGLLPPMLGQQRSVQKNEPHPFKSHGYDGIVLEWYNSDWAQQIHQKERLRTKVRFVS